MTRPLNAPAGRAPSTDRRTPRPKLPAVEDGKLGASDRPPLGTRLVASCGWPTDAAQPARRRAVRR